MAKLCLEKIFSEYYRKELVTELAAKPNDTHKAIAKALAEEFFSVLNGDNPSKSLLIERHFFPAQNNKRKDIEKLDIPKGLVAEIESVGKIFSTPKNFNFTKKLLNLLYQRKEDGGVYFYMENMFPGSKMFPSKKQRLVLEKTDRSVVYILSKLDEKGDDVLLQIGKFLKYLGFDVDYDKDGYFHVWYVPPSELVLIQKPRVDYIENPWYKKER